LSTGLKLVFIIVDVWSDTVVSRRRLWTRSVQCHPALSCS